MIKILGVLCGALCLIACNDYTSDRGAQSIAELCEQYESAHRDADVERAAKLLAVYYGRPIPSPDYPDPFTSSLRKLVTLPLDRVEFVPLEVPEGGSALIRYGWTKNPHGNDGRRDGIAGAIRGRLVLVRKDGTELDPGFIIVPNGNRFLIHVAMGVIMDAGDSVKEGREPYYYLAETHKYGAMPRSME